MKERGLRWLIFAWEPRFHQTKIFLLHDTKTKISYDAMKLSPFCKLHLIAKSIYKLMILSPFCKLHLIAKSIYKLMINT